MRSRRARGRVLAAVVLLAMPVAGIGQQQDPPPRDLGLTERAGTALAQLDVTVTGPEDVVDRLGRSDFELRVAGRYIEEFTVDRVCRYGTPSGTRAVAASREDGGESVAAEVPAPAPATFVFFFDMTHLTMTGYHRSFQIAEEMVPQLFEGNAQAMVVSSAREMKVVQEFTSDPQEILDAFERLQKDRSQFDPFAMEEVSRIQEVLDGIAKDRDIGISYARRMQQQEAWRARRSMHRISMVMGRLADLDPPKAFVYFSDTMRSNPGEHYLSFFPRSLERDPGFEAVIQTGADADRNSFDRVINEASALGVRFYSVEGQGLVAGSITDPSPAEASTRRIRDAQNTLVGMARESGGAAFINGVPGKKIVERMRSDLSCIYLVSFSPEGFDLDEPLAVRLTSTHPKVRVRTRGRLVIPSESTRRTARLMAAFATAPSARATGSEGVSVGPFTRVVPNGFEAGEFSALVQVTVPGTRIPNATWDLGTSLVSRGAVREAAARIRTPQPGVRVVLERLMRFPPGPYELISVAHETTTDQVLSARVESAWPDPNENPASVGPIAILQPETGAFLRDDQVRDSGALALGEDDPVRTDRPTAIVGLVCRAKRQKGKLRVERELVGESAVEFGKVVLADDGGRCAQIRDLIRADQMVEGGFEYHVRVYDGSEEIATGAVEFYALGPES